MANQIEIRLQKYLAECGVASRRKAEELIAQNKVKVNGHPVKIGDKVNPRKDLVTVNGKKVSKVTEKHYIMLYKPRGFVTTVSDEMGRKTVMDLVSDVKTRLYPVGRLDKDSEGLLLLTNDGDFANAMTHPRQHVSKTYRVTVRPSISDKQLLAFEDGMDLDGTMTQPVEASVVTKEEGRVVLELVLHEGRNRQIRRMCEALELEVARLKRTAFGPLKMGMLQQGKWRELTDAEVKKLLHAAGEKQPKK